MQRMRMHGRMCACRHGEIEEGQGATLGALASCMTRAHVLSCRHSPRRPQRKARPLPSKMREEPVCGGGNMQTLSFIGEGKRSHSRHTAREGERSTTQIQAHTQVQRQAHTVTQLGRMGKILFLSKIQ